jgi:hypothetical protein
VLNLRYAFYFLLAGFYAKLFILRYFSIKSKGKKNVELDRLGYRYIRLAAYDDTVVVLREIQPQCRGLSRRRPYGR